MTLQRKNKTSYGNHLMIGGCNAIDLAKKYGTPLYVLNEETWRAQCRRYHQAFAKHYLGRSRIAYASKALLAKGLCPIIQSESLFLDVASAGELYTAVKAKFPMKKIFLHGNCKTSQEITMALKAGVGRLVVDNEQELELINQLGKRHRRTANILLRLTPGVDAHTHRHIKTGHLDSKFGIPLVHGLAQRAAERALNCRWINLCGFHFHLGSQIFDLKPYETLIQVAFDFLANFRKKTGFVAQELDLGGGLGVRYASQKKPPSIENYAKKIGNHILEQTLQWAYPLPDLIIEPGRSLVSDAGITLYKIHYIKELPWGKNFVIVDGGISDNPRPALYGAQYEVTIADRSQAPTNYRCTISGKHCETDTLFENVKISKPKIGDLLAVFSTGAYNYSMASNYNRYPKPAMVIVSGKKPKILVKRQELKDLIYHDQN